MPNLIKFAYSHSKVTSTKTSTLINEGHMGAKHRVFGFSADDGQLWKVTINHHLCILREVNDLYNPEDV